MYSAASSNGPWSSRTSSFGATGINSIAFGNGIWVAGGAEGKIASSTSGTTGWMQRSLPGVGGMATISVAFGNGIFVATSDTGPTWTSVDGITWVANAGLIGGNPFRVDFVNGLFISGGGFASSSAMAYSLDGVNWVTESPGISLRAFAPFGAGVLGVGPGGGIYISEIG